HRQSIIIAQHITNLALRPNLGTHRTQTKHDIADLDLDPFLHDGPNSVPDPWLSAVLVGEIVNEKLEHAEVSVCLNKAIVHEVCCGIVIGEQLPSLLVVEKNDVGNILLVDCVATLSTGL